jgi:hypothetical protein
MTVRIYRCHYVISGYYSNELFRKRQLCSRSRTKNGIVSVYRVYSVSTDAVLMWIYEL